MSDEAIAREIQQLRADLKEDFAELRAQLAALLPREVYNAHHDALKSRIGQLEREMDAAETHRMTTRRWMVSAVALPAVSMIVMIILAVVRP